MPQKNTRSLLTCEVQVALWQAFWGASRISNRTSYLAHAQRYHRDPRLNVRSGGSNLGE
jgi:hypothetical protein